MQVSSLHVRKDLPALSGYSEGEQQQYGKVTLGFPHWAPEKEQINKENRSDKYDSEITIIGDILKHR